MSTFSTGAWDEEHDDEPRFVTCDICGKRVPADTIWHGTAYGIETFACEECRS